MGAEQEEAYRKAAEKFDAFGPLGVTAEDHKTVGSTPSEEQSANPGKTLSDLMSDEEILRYLEEEKKIIENYQDFLWRRKKTLTITINYLKSINRLPDGF